MIYIGCHLSVTDGYEAMGRTMSRFGGNTFAWFTRNPRGGRTKPVRAEDMAALLLHLKKEGFGPLVAHGSYTMNLCSAKEETRANGLDMLAKDLERMQLLPGNYYNFHPGAHTGQGVEKGIDQISNVLELIRTQPDSRRMVVTAWNPAEVEQMALPPCHALFQFYVANGKLSCQLYQRSCDMFLGVPFNIASYSLLTMMMAQQAGLEPGEFVWTGGDCHIYDNHVDQVLEQLSREPYPYPTMKLHKADSLFEYDYGDFEIVDYRYHPTIKAPIAV